MTWAKLIAVAAFVALLGSVLILAGACSSGDEGPTRLTVGGPRVYYGAYLLPTLERPNFTLTDTNGRSFAFGKATRNRVTLLFFGYTKCPDVCPTTMADIAAGMRQLPQSARDRITVVFVTTDPKRDQPQVLREWLDNFDSSFIGLTGDQAEINKLMQSLRLPSPLESETTTDGYSVIHARDVLLFTQDNTAHLAYPGGATADEWKADLEKLVREGFKKPKSD